MWIDGYIDGASESRLMLSNELDFERVDRVRAGVDAILVGATTVRNDNPRLLGGDTARRRPRVRRGLPESPTKVTVTERGRLDPSSRFFADDGADKPGYGSSCAVDLRQRRRVYGQRAGTHRLGRRVGPLTQSDAGGEPVRMRELAEDLHGRGVRRLMVE